jgi:hypothetical protein
MVPLVGARILFLAVFFACSHSMLSAQQLPDTEAGKEVDRALVNWGINELNLGVRCVEFSGAHLTDFEDGPHKVEFAGSLILDGFDFRSERIVSRGDNPRANSRVGLIRRNRVVTAIEGQLFDSPIPREVDTEALKTSHLISTRLRWCLPEH